MIPQQMGAFFYRGTLSPQGKRFYDRIYSCLLQPEPVGSVLVDVVSGKTAASDCFAAYWAVQDDHPELFFMGTEIDYRNRGKTTGELRFPILYPWAVQVQIRAQLCKLLSQLVRGTAMRSQPEQEILIYERIAKKLTYENHHDIRDHTVVGPVLTNSGVCEGFNALLLLCLRRAGIPCIKVYGRGSTQRDGRHCWSIAWVQGQPVHCDVTWDARKDGPIRFNYLNLSDRQIALDHCDFAKDTIPKCQTESLTYYALRGLVADSPGALRRFVKEGERTGSPVQVHLAYAPKEGDVVGEVQRAFRTPWAEVFYVNEGLRNVTILPRTESPASRR